MSYGVQIRLLRAGETAPDLEPPNFVYVHPRGGRFEYRINGLSGGHLLHLAVAGCLFNGIVRVARERGIHLSHALVRADGGFNEEGTRSTGINYWMEVEGDASHDELTDLASFVREDSSVPQIVGHGASVEAADVVVTASRRS
jgi:uncharacterized OsmC-like protein